VPAVADAAGLRGTPALGTTAVLSRATQALLEDAGFPDVRLVPPGIDLQRWPVQPRTRHRGAPPVVAFAGHYDAEGGLWESVQALGSLARAGRPVSALFLMRRRPGQDEARAAASLLRAAHEAGLGDGAVERFLGHAPGPEDDHLDPIRRVPLGVPVWCVHGREDDTVPIDQSRSYVTAARAAGDRAELLEVEGDHFVVVDPDHAAWARTLEILGGISGGPAAAG
jgi:pimeloyl-ACP methyl ester carboxylesterase